MLIDSFGGIPLRGVIASWLGAFSQFDGYSRMFGQRLLEEAGSDSPHLSRPFDRLPKPEQREIVLAALSRQFVPATTYFAELDALRVQAVCVWVHVDPASSPHVLDELADYGRQAPGRLLPIVSYAPSIGDIPARLEQDARPFWIERKGNPHHPIGGIGAKLLHVGMLRAV
jgi:hypothetical protein